MKDLKDCKVLVTTTSYGTQDPTLKPYLEEQVGQVVYNTSGKPLAGDELIAHLAGVDGYIAGLDTISAEVLNVAKELKVVARYGVGYSNVDLEAAKANGIVVTNTPGANAKAVAELTVALILALFRPIIPACEHTKAGDWPRYKGLSLVGRTIGLLGFGAIGKEVARRLSGFECQVLAYDPYPDEEFATQIGVQLVSQEEVMTKADLISLHLPGLPETAGMVNDDFLKAIKPGSFLVNTARGELLEEEAVARALISGQLQGAALDVFQHEPPGESHPLLAFDQVITTPHMGAHADSATNAMGWMSTHDCLAVLRGEEPKYPVF